MPYSSCNQAFLFDVRSMSGKLLPCEDAYVKDLNAYVDNLLGTNATGDDPEDWQIFNWTLERTKELVELFFDNKFTADGVAEDVD